MTISQIAKQIAKLSNKKIKVKISRKKANIAVQICSNNKIKKQIGWKPKINFLNGLKSVFEDVKKNMSKILVTGGAGYIGSILTEQLLIEGFDVTIIDNFMYSDSSLNHLHHYDNLKIVKGDVRDKKKS